MRFRSATGQGAARRRTATVLALAVGAASVAVAAPVAQQAAQAASVKPLTSAYSKTVYGDFVLVGNGNLRCPVAGDNPLTQSGTTTCASGNTRSSTAVNDNFDMQWNVLAGSATGIFNSSSASVTIPTGATVDFARLYWSGTTGYRAANTTQVPTACGARQVTIGTNATLPSTRGTAPVVTGSPQTTPVQLSVNGGANTAILPASGSYTVDRGSISSSSSEYYSAYADVTSTVNALPRGSAQTVALGNVWTPRGFNCYAGWSLVYVFKYDQADPTYAPSLRNVQLFDGHVRQFSGEPDTTLPIPGLHTTTNSSRVGVTSYEGDFGITGDRLLINGTALGEPLAPATTDNFFTSAADGRASPNVANNYSVDAKSFTTNLIPAASTSANLTFATTSDSWLTQNVVLSTPEPEIRVTKTASRTTTRAGGAIQFTITVTNPSSVPVTNVSTTDPQFPECSRTGLGDLPPNGSITYTCDTVAPASSYTNSVTASGTDSFGDSVANSATTQGITVIHPAITLTKNADKTSYNSGDTITFTLRATNSGDAPLNAVTVSDPAATTCNRTFAALAAGASQTWTCTATAPFAGASNSASVTAQDDTGAPVTANATAPAPTNGSISGRIFADVNGNGAVESSDTGIGGVTLTLTGTTAGGVAINRSTTSGSDGSWSFTAVPPGTYRVTETQPTAYDDGLDTPGTGATSTVNDTIDLTLGDAGTSTGTLFAERPTGTMGGFVYEDQNANGTKDSGEPGLASVTINLTGTDDGGNSVSRTTTTSSTGAFGFAGLRAGTYILTQPTQPSGYTDGKEKVGTVNGSPSGTLSGTDTLQGIVLPARGTGANYTFGEVKTGTLTGTVALDGVANTGTSVTVTLTGTDDQGAAVTLTTTTGSTGTFQFSGLRPGTYALTETQPAAYGTGSATNGTPAGTVVNANSITGIALVSGTNAAGYVFNDTSATLSGTVYEDLNRDGVRTSGESGYGGNLTVTISGPGGTRTALTAANGTYSLAGLAAGSYTVSFAAPSGTSLTSAGTLTVAVPAGGSAPNNDFGLRRERPPTAVNDTTTTPYETAVTIPVLTNDSDPDGDAIVVQSFMQPTHGAVSGTTGPLTYTPNPGWSGTETFQYTITDSRTGTSTATVTVTTGAKPNAPPAFTSAGTNDAQTVVVGGPLAALAATDPDSDPLTYALTGGTLPAGVTLNSDGTFAGSPSAAGSFPVVVTVSDGRGGTDTTNLVITVRATGTLSGQVFADVNGDGVRQTVDTGIGGVTITLAGQPDQVGAAPINQTTTTATDGSWTFPGIPAGSYTVTETQPSGFVTSINTAGTNAALSGADGLQVTLADGATSAGSRFGERPQASLTGVVYDDSNANGTRQGGEPGIGSVTLTVTGTDEAGNSVSTTTTTASDGTWTVANLRAGSYTVTETQPAGWLDGKEVVGTAGGTLSGTDAITGITLGRTTAATGYQWAEVRAASLAGSVTRDGSTPQSGVTITLTGTNDLGAAVSRTATSGTTGAWSITNLRPGTYQVVETQPAAYGAGTATAGTAGGTVSGANAVQAITLGSGTAGTGYVFNDTSASLAGTVFEDLNRNAAKDSGEPGYLSGGYTVSIAGPAGTVTATAAANGTWSAAGLVAGTYTISFTAPSGSSLTTPASRSVTLPAGSSVTGQDFGLRQERTPVANADTATTPYQSAVTIPVLANDTDPDGDALSITTRTLPANGSVTCTATNCTYTPNAGFTGTDSFTYTITDGRSGTATAPVTVTVGSPPNQPPVYTGATTNTAQTVALGAVPAALAATDPEGQPVTYALVSGALPPGISLNPDGTFSGAATTPGTYTVTIAAADPLGAATNTTLTITVPPAANQPPTYTSATTNTAQSVPVGTAPARLLATDPEGAILTYGPAAGTLPPGVTLHDDGTFSGTATTPGTYTVDVPVTDPGGLTATTHLVVMVTNQPPSYTGATTNTAQTVNNGFTPTRLYATDPEGQALTYGPVSSGALPPGVTLNPDGTFVGTITGVAVTTDYVATIPVSDPFGGTASTTLTIHVPIPADQPPAYTSATTNTAQTVAIGGPVTALAATDPESEALTYGPPSSGSLPPGVTLNPDGTFSGAPTTAGTYTATIPVRDTAGGVATTTLTITVPAPPNNPPVFGPEATNTNQVVGVGTTPTALTVSDPDGDTPLTVTQVSGSVPPGVGVTPTGAFSGTATTAGTYVATFRVTDPGGLFADHTLTFTVPAPDEPPAYTSAPSNTAQTVYVDGAVAPVVAVDPEGGAVTYAVVGGTLPPGVTLNANGTFGGSPTTVGIRTVRIRATDPVGLQAFTDLTITTPNRPPAYTGAATNTAQSIANGSGLTALLATDPDHQALTFGPVSSGALPPGVTLNPDGTFGGTATTHGTYTATIPVSDGNGGTASTTLTVTVANRAPVITSAPTRTILVGNRPSAVTATDADGDPVTFAVTSGTLPPGLTLISTGAFTGSATTAGSYPVVVTASDGQGGTTTQNLTIVVDGPPAFTSDPANTAQTVFVDGAVAPVHATDPENEALTYSLTSGTLPPGVTLNADGTFSGSPTTVGSYPVTITVRDTVNQAATTNLTITVPNRAPVFGAASTNTAQTIAVGGTPVALTGSDPDHQPITFSLVSGAIPGVTLAPAGTWSGTATTPGTYTLQVRLTDSLGATTDRTLTVTVPTGTPVVTSGDQTILTGQQPSTVTATDPNGLPVTFSAPPGQLPPGLTLNPDGTWSGTATTIGSYPVSITVGNGTQSSTTVVTITVQGPPIYTGAPSNTAQTVYVDGALTPLAATDPEGGTLTYALVSGALPAGVTLNANGTFSGSPTVVTDIGPPTSATIRVTDPQGLTATTVLSVTVPNRPPVIPAGGANDDQRVAVNGLPAPLIASDPDHQTLTFTAVSGLPPGLTLNPNGTWAGSATTEGSYDALFSVADGKGGTATHTVHLVVSTPTVTSPSAQTIPTGGTPAAVTAVGAPGDVLLFAASPGTLPPGVTMNADGTWSGAATTPGSYPVVFTVDDQHGSVVTSTVTVTVDAPPAFTGAPGNTAQTVYVDGALSPLAATDPEGSALTYALTSGALPPGVTLNADGTFAGSPTAVGSYPVTVTVRDTPFNQPATTVLTITVPNRDPSFGPESTNASQTVAVGSVPAPLTGSDPDHQALLFTVDNPGALPPGLTLNPDGSWAGSPTTQGTYTLTISVDDGHDGIVTRTLTLVVPTQTGGVTSPATQTIPVGGTPTPVTATDPDGDPLTFATASPLPPGVTLNPDGTFSGPATGPLGGGTFPVVVTIDDGNGGTLTTTTTIVVDGPPVFTSAPANTAQTVFVDGAVAPLQATDPENAALTYTTSSPLPPGVALSPDGTFSGSPTQTGSFPVVVTVTDPFGQTAMTTVVISVPNRNPVFGSEPTNTAQTIGSGGSGTPLTGSDPDHQTLTYAVSSGSLPPGLTLDPDGTFSGTPTVPGSYPVTITLDDGHGGTATHALTITVPVTNAPPFYTSAASNTTQSVLVGGAIGRLLATDPEGEALFYTLTSGALPPGVTLNADGTFSGTPSVPGTFTITVVVSDPHLASDTTTLVITVTAPPANQPPVFTGATANTSQTLVNGGTPARVLATDPDGDPLTYVLTGGSLPPGVVLNSNGTFSGAAAPGTSTAQITVSDGRGGSDTTTLVITVTSPNTAPTAVDDARTTPHGTPITVAVRGNDSDVDGDGLTVTAVTQPSTGGTVAIDSGPGGTGDVVVTPASTFTGDLVFTYTISDGNGGTATATVTVTVLPAAPPNLDPAYTSAPTNTAQSVRVGRPLTALAATDPEGQPLAYALSSGALPPGVVLNPDGSFTGSPTTAGTYDVFVLVSDPDGGSAVTHLVITVLANRVPSAGADPATTPYGVGVDVPVLGNDSDPDGDTLTVLAVGVPVSGTALLLPSGQVRFLPAAGFSGVATFDYTVADGHGGTATATVTVTVGAPPVVNAVPVARDDAAATTTLHPVTIAVLGNDTDADGGTLTVITVNQPAHGFVVPGAGGTLVYTSTTGFVGTDTFTYLMSDGQGGSASATVTVVVTAPNAAPVAVADSAATHGTGPVTIPVLANDTDLEGDPLTVTAVSSPGHGTASIVGGQVVYTPASGFTGVDTFTYTISDGHGNTAMATGTVTVSANGAPATKADGGTTKPGQPVRIPVLPNDVDPDGDVLSVVGFTQPAHGTVTLVDGVFTYVPEQGWSGEDAFTYTVSDGHGGVQTQTVTVRTAATSGSRAPNLPDLPNTGSDSTALLTWSLVLVGAGALLLLLGRRRREG